MKKFIILLICITSMLSISGCSTTDQMSSSDVVATSSPSATLVVSQTDQIIKVTEAITGDNKSKEELFAMIIDAIKTAGHNNENLNSTYNATSGIKYTYSDVIGDDGLPNSKFSELTVDEQIRWYDEMFSFLTEDENLGPYNKGEIINDNFIDALLEYMGDFANSSNISTDYPIVNIDGIDMPTDTKTKSKIEETIVTDEFGGNYKKIYESDEISVSISPEPLDLDMPQYSIGWDVYIVNNSSNNVTIEFVDTSLEGFAVDALCLIKCPAGKKAMDCFKILDTDLNKLKVHMADSISEVGFVLKCVDSDNCNEIWSTDNITINY